MLTIRQNLLETIRGGKPDRFVRQYEFLKMLGTPFASVLGFFTTDVVTLLFTLTVLWIVRRLDGIFEDQNHYLARVSAEQERERGGLR